MKHVYFIEGADNVGKSTCVQRLEEMTSDIKSNVINFHSYPNKDTTRIVNEIIMKNKPLTQKDLDAVIYTFLANMANDGIFKNTEQYKSVYICDRGWLSTFIYNYLPYQDADSKDRIKDSLNRFRANYLYKWFKIESNVHIIILNNNHREIKLPINEYETVEYKKMFDKNIYLQDKVNTALSTFVSLIDDDSYRHRLKEFKNFHYINIYNEDKNRKSTDDLCKEIISIINKEEN